MKKFLIKTGILLSGVFLFFACNKDVEVLDVFSFDFFVKSEPDGFVFEVNDVNVSVVPERKVEGVTYNITYDIIQGDGYFENINGNLLKEGESSDIEDFNTDLKWIPQEVGQQKIEITISDVNGNKQTKEIEFLSKRAPFTYVANLTTETYPINEKTAVRINLIRNENDTFQFSYVVSDANGEFFLEDSNTKIEDTLTLSAGTTDLFYKPLTLGAHKVTTSVVAPDAAFRNKILNINSVHIPFDFRVTPSAQEAALGVALPINISLETDSKNDNVTYSYIFNYSENSINGTLKDANGKEIIPGTSYPIEPEDYRYTFETSTAGTAAFEFTVTDSNEQIKTAIADVDFLNIPFTFNGAVVDKKIPINSTTTINFSLEPLSKNENTTYTISYTNATGTGELIDERGVNTVLEPGIKKELSPGNFSLTYTPFTLGEHNLVFEAKDSFEEARVLEVELEAINIPIIFNVSSDSEVFVNEPFDVDFDVNALGVNETIAYDLQYTLVGGIGSFAQTLEDAQGAFVNVSRPSFSDTFTPTEPGVYEFLFTLKDPNGQLISQSISVVVKNNDFQFNAAATNTSVVVGEQGGINFNVLPNRVDPNIQYQLSYEFSGVPFELLDGNLSLPVATNRNINVGNSSYQIKAIETGTSEITFSVLDANGNLQTDTVSMEFVNQDFDFTSSFSNELFINQREQFNYALTPSNVNTRLTYQFSYTVSEGTGSLLRGNNTIPQGTFVDVSPINFNYDYLPTTDGNHTINYRIKDSNGQEKTFSQSFNVENIDFEFNATQNQRNLIVGNEDKINLNINQDLSADIDYTLTYAISGPGQLLDSRGNILQNGTVLNEGITELTYTSNLAGESSIEFSLTDENNITKKQTLTYQIENIDFEFSANGGGKLLLNNEEEFNLFLNQEGSSDSVGYTVSFVLDQSSVGNGVVKRTNGSAIAYATDINLNQGSTPFIFEANRLGFVNLLITATSKNGITKQSNVSFNVENVNFTITAAPEKPSLFIGQSTNFNFNLSEDVDSGSQYEISYIPVAGQGIIKNGSEILSNNRFYPISLGVTSFVFEANTVGTVEYLFTVKNRSTGIEKTVTVTTNVIELPTPTFTLNTTATENSALVGENVTVNVNIREQNGPTTYQLIYTSSKASSVEYLGTTYNAGQPIFIEAGFSTLEYTGLEAGTNDISFEVVNQANVSQNSNISIDYKTIDFNLATSGDGNIFLNNEKEFNAFISQNTSDPSITYKVAFGIASTSTGLGEIRTVNNALVNFGEENIVNIGANRYYFKGTQLGQVELIVGVQDSNGLVKRSSVIFNVENIDFNFTVASQRTSLLVGEDTNLNFNINEGVVSGTNYEIKYVVDSGNAQLKNGSINLNTNTNYPISIGNSSWDFVSQTEGNVAITFTVKNTSTGIEKTATTTIEVAPLPNSEFTFTAIPSRNSAIVNDGIPVNLNIVESNGSSTYSLVYTSDKNSNVIYNGITYSQGEPINITAGATSLIYVGKEGGTNAVNFIVTNSNTTPITQSADVSIDYENIDFNLTASGDGDVFVNGTKEINLFLSQQISDPSITYQVRYSIASGSVGAGTISQNGFDITLGTLNPIILGTTQIDFKGTILGATSLKIEVIDSNGVVHEDIVSITVKNIDFNFSAVAQTRTITLGETTSLNFNITESANSGTLYEMKYEITSGRGELEVGGISRTSNVFYPLSLGASSWSFISNNAETVEILFTAINVATRVEKTSTVTIEVQPLPDASFTLSANPSRNEQIINQVVPININIIESNGPTTYTAIFTTSENGSFSYNGNTYTSGQSFTVPAGSFSVDYTGSNPGAHDIDITIANANTTPLVLSDNVSIDYSSIDFTLATAGDGSVFINNQKDFNVFLTQTTADPSITYQVRYSIVGGSSGNLKVFNGNSELTFGTLYPINIGSVTPSIEGISVGDVELLVEVLDSNGVTKQSIVNFTVENVDFNFTAAPQSNTINLNNSTNINFNLTETVSSNTTYEMSYVITSGDGELRNGTNMLASNVPYNVNVGFYNWQFVGTVQGDIEIEFTVRNMITGEEKKKTVAVEVILNDFNFTVTPTKSSLFVNENLDLNFNITGANDPSALKVRYAYNSNFAEITNPQGDLLISGLLYDTANSFTWKMKATNKGNLAVTFFISDPATGIEKNQTIALTVTEPDFIFISTREKAEAAVREAVKVTLNITEIEGSGDNYRAYYATSRNGIFNYNGTDYSPGEVFQLTGLNSFGTYTGESEGIHDVEFVVVSESVNKQKQDDISIEFQPIEFDLSISATNSSTQDRSNGNIVGDVINLEHIITETGGVGNYKVSYSIDGISNVLRDNNGNTLVTGVEYPVTAGVFLWEFVGDNPGITTIKYRLKDEFGNEITKEQIIEIKRDPFDFIITPTGADQFTLEDYTFDIELTKAPKGLDYAYTLKAISNNDATISYKGVEIPNGQEFEYFGNDPSFTINSKDAGIVNYRFEMVDPDGGVTEIRNIVFDFKLREFDFTVSAAGNTFINEDALFRVDLSNNPGPLTYQLSVTAPNNDLNSILFSNLNLRVSEGIKLGVGPFSNNIFVNTKDEGINELTFTVTANNGFSLEKNVRVDFVQKIIFTNVSASRSNPRCGQSRATTKRNQIYVEYTKSSNSRLTQININNLTNGSSKSVNVNSTNTDNSFAVISGGCNEILALGVLNFSENDLIEVTLLDSNGITSNPLRTNVR